MSVKLQTEHHFEFLNLKGGCTGSSESTFVKTPHCWKSRVFPHMIRIHVTLFIWIRESEVRKFVNFLEGFIFSKLPICEVL